MILKKLIKKVISLPPVKRKYVQLQELRNQNEALIQKIELRESRNKFLIKQLSELFDDNVELAWAGDSKRRKYVCMQPFTRIEVMRNGEIVTCCRDWLKHGCSLGNAYENTFEEIWNSDIAKKIRYGVSKGKFEYCNQKYWPALNHPEKHPDKMKNREEWMDEEGVIFNNWNECSVKTTPSHIHLAIDMTCNLRCISCRGGNTRVNTVEDNTKITQLLENFVRPALKNCTLLSGFGAGEFLASKPIIDFYSTLSKEEYPLLKLNLMTNGILFTKDRWSKLENLNGMVGNVRVSVDAATKDTYEKLRLGGNWDTLCKNMEYLSQLKASGKIKSSSVGFVVCDENFREMNDFVILAKQWGVNSINFQRIKNWGTFGSDFYHKVDVFSPENLFYQEAVEIIKQVRQEKEIKITDNLTSEDS
jgi:MoaA/NifB/PqqE/SkfB family radical SAM enzyme